MGKGLTTLLLVFECAGGTWGKEQFPKFKSKGNLRLLEEPLTALFCSARCPGDLILMTYDLARVLRNTWTPVIGGFQTPMERECLRLLLRGKQPVVVCPARSIDNMRIPRDWRGPLNEGKLLVISPFLGTVRRATAESAAQRNELVASLAAQVFIAHARRAQKQDVGGFSFEGQACQLLDPRLRGGRTCLSSVEGWKPKSTCSRVRWKGRCGSIPVGGRIVR